MARPLRVEFDGALYHLTARGNRRAAIFEDDADRARFLELLARSLARFEDVLHAFVLMDNHFHLLAQTRRANLSCWPPTRRASSTGTGAWSMATFSRVATRGKGVGGTSILFDIASE